MHQRWQIDFKVAIVYPGGYAILVTVRDVVGAAYIALALIPVASKTAHIQEEQVCAVLLIAFQVWGLPDEIQTDGEGVLAGQPQDAFPSRFTLWLTGLGIKHRIIRPGKPTDNAEVERAHRAVFDYALKGQQHQTLEQLQAALAQAQQELNGEYPSCAHGCNHQPPLVAHPQLLTPRRSLDGSDLGNMFSLERVDAFLASQKWERKVGKTGQITFRDKLDRFCVGRKYARQIVVVHFDPKDRSFVVWDDQDEEIARSPARCLNFEDVFHLPPKVIPSEQTQV